MPPSSFGGHRALALDRCRQRRIVRRNAGRVVALEVNDPEPDVMSQELGYATSLSVVRDAQGADLALRIQHGCSGTVLTVLPPTLRASRLLEL